MPQRIAFSDKSCYRKDIFAHLENVLASFAPKTRSFCQPNDGHHQAWRRIMSSFECMVLPNAQQGILARNLSLSLSPLLSLFLFPSIPQATGDRKVGLWVTCCNSQSMNCEHLWWFFALCGSLARQNCVLTCKTSGFTHTFLRRNYVFS